MTDQSGVLGQVDPTDFGNDFNALSSLVDRLSGRYAHITLVQVKAVTNNGEIKPVGTVDVQPLVNQIDGAGNATPHGTIYGLPYFRLQGGTSAVIVDPKVGDIGLAAFADRDISSVKATKARANPGSRRRFSWSDGLYIGGFLNGTPVRYIAFTDNGILIVDPASVKVMSPKVEVDASTSLIVKSPSITFSS